MDMLTLLIDTCTERGILAIFKDDHPLFLEELPFGLQNSKALMPAMEKAFKKLGMSTADIDLVAVGVGPGSYTGIRVGVATAKALAFTHRHPLVGVSTLYGLIPNGEGRFVALIDAKIGGAYYLLGQRTQDGIEYASVPEVAPLEKVAELIAEEDTLVTPATFPLKDKLAKVVSGTKWHWFERAPDATQMVRIARESYQKGHYSSDSHVEILYLRKTQAELDKAAS